MFVLKHWRFLGFGFLLTFVCNFGQTFFVGLYNNSIREAYDLSQGDFGALYGAATLLSAGVLVWIGRLIDRVDLRFYTLCVIVGMAAGCTLMFVGNSIILLGMALAVLRLTGQGLMPHVSSTSMGRYFNIGRGRAISVTYMGINTGQIVLPILASFLIGFFGWRASWAVYGLLLLFFILPLSLFFLRGHVERHRRWEAQMTLADGQTGQHSRMRYSLRKGVFKDKRFFIILPGLLSMSLFGTSLFFFQDVLLAAKGWDATLFAFSFPFYAVAMLLAVLGGGFFIDRIGSSLKVLPFIYLPFIISFLVLTVARAPVWLPAMMALAGISNGLGAVLGGTLWPELYGTRALGSVRAFVTSVMVLGTALTPAVVGFLYDAGVSVETTFIAFAVYMIVFGVIQLPLGYGRLAKSSFTNVP